MTQPAGWPPASRSTLPHAAFAKTAPRSFRESAPVAESSMITVLLMSKLSARCGSPSPAPPGPPAPPSAALFAAPDSPRCLALAARMTSVNSKMPMPPRPPLSRSRTMASAVSTVRPCEAPSLPLSCEVSSSTSRSSCALIFPVPSASQSSKSSESASSLSASCVSRFRSHSTKSGQVMAPTWLRSISSKTSETTKAMRMATASGRAPAKARSAASSLHGVTPASESPLRVSKTPRKCSSNGDPSGRLAWAGSLRISSCASLVPRILDARDLEARLLSSRSFGTVKLRSVWQLVLLTKLWQLSSLARLIWWPCRGDPLPRLARLPQLWRAATAGSASAAAFGCGSSQLPPLPLLPRLPQL
mmetsp:Transcript_111322/g.359371  ORF Transcript_111322/g.359371 Transcript_111322/m.359371 type:complete len:360 (+) Transcript_111322:1329-2408(+)